MESVNAHGRRLGLAVDEGVERGEQVESCSGSAHDLAGLPFARPLPPDEHERMLAITPLGEFAA